VAWQIDRRSWNRPAQVGRFSSTSLAVRWPKQNETVSDCDYLQIPLYNVLLRLRLGDVICGEDLGKPREPDADEAGIAHHVEDFREGNPWEVVPQVGAKRPADITIRGKAPGGPRKCAGERNEGGASSNVHGHPKLQYRLLA